MLCLKKLMPKNIFNKVLPNNVGNSYREYSYEHFKAINASTRRLNDTNSHYLKRNETRPRERKLKKPRNNKMKLLVEKLIEDRGILDVYNNRTAIDKFKKEYYIGPEGTMNKIIQQFRDKLTTRLFNVERKPYTPLPNADHLVKEAFFEVYKPAMSKGWLSTELTDIPMKFQFLEACNKLMKYQILSCILCKMETAQDVLEYYTTEVKGVNPFEALVQKQNSKLLPPNMYIQPEPIRFHPDTDTFFDGVTAFPNNPTILRNLKAKKKYKGHGTMIWPDM